MTKRRNSLDVIGGIVFICCLFAAEIAAGSPGRLEVELGITGPPVPNEVTVMFPTITVAGETFNFVRARLPLVGPLNTPFGVKFLYAVDADNAVQVTGATTEFFASHPDQWDRLLLFNEFGTQPIEFNSLRVTFIPRNNKTNAFLQAGNLVRTPGTGDTPTLAPAILPCEADGTTHIPLPGGMGVLNEPPISYRLGNLIRERRERIAECVLEAAYKRRTGNTIDIDFNNLPLSIREAAYDMGQYGRSKYRQKSPGFSPTGLCSTYQKYFQLNYTDHFAEDFPAPFPYHEDYLDAVQKGTEYWRCYSDGGDSHAECRSGYFNYPYPSGTSYRWNEAVLSQRTLARIKLTSLGSNSGGMSILGYPVVKIEHPQNSPESPIPTMGGWWEDTAQSYVPKPGDMLWRYSRCTYSMHAMTLVDTPQIVNGALTATVFENVGLWANFHPRQGLNIGSLLPPVFENGTEWDTNGDGDIDDEEIYECVQSSHSGRWMCPEQADQATGEPRLVWNDYLKKWVVQRCESALLTTPDTRQYLYFIGETFHPEEWFVSYGGVETLHRIGHGILATPIDPILKNTVSSPIRENPTFDQLRLVDLNGDDQDDVLWRRDNGELLVSASCEGEQACQQIVQDHLVSDPDYVGWTSLGTYPGMDLVYRNENKGVISFGDFGTSAADATPDGRIDLLKTWKNSANQIVFSVLFNTPSGFNEEIISAYSTNLSLSTFNTNMRVGDFNGDGVSDILKKVDDRWRVRWSGRGSNWPTLRTGVPQSLGYFYPVHNFGGNGRTAMLKVSSLPDGRANIWYTTLESNRMGPWRLLLTTQVSVDRHKMAFGRFNADNMVDLFTQRTNYGKTTWEVYASNSIGVYVHYTLNPDAKPISQLKFGDMDGDGITDVFAYHKDFYRGIL